MSGKKTLLAVLIALPVPAGAIEGTPASDFATCAGRFSAELEHAWLLPDESQREIERHRTMFIDLMDASFPPEQSSHAMSLRIAAKAAHASLLAQATFSQDRDRALWAVRRAENEIAYCHSFLLES